jgi:hypothetical protein
LAARVTGSFGPANKPLSIQSKLMPIWVIWSCSSVLLCTVILTVTELPIFSVCFDNTGYADIALGSKAETIPLKTKIAKTNETMIMIFCVFTLIPLATGIFLSNYILVFHILTHLKEKSSRKQT